MAKMNRSQAKKLLEDLGIAAAIDWSKIKSWVEFLQMILALLSNFKAQPQAMRTVAVDELDEESRLEFVKAHFECIQEVAACGADCCKTGG